MDTQERIAPPSRSVVVPITVRFGDTDPYGVVFFASYFRYCHQGIEEFFRQLGILPENTFKNVELGFGLPVVEARCSFFRPVRYGQTIRLAVFIQQVRPKSLTFGFHFYPEQGDDLLAKGEATLVAIDRDWKSRAMPESVCEALAPFLPHMHTS